ncbi:MAG: histidinol-phosphate transaminase [Promethearchaeota archaeon]
MDLSKLLRKNWTYVKAYKPGEQPADPEGWVKLNTNENPYPPPRGVLDDLVSAATGAVRLYPDPTCQALRSIISSTILPENRSVSGVDSVLVGLGADELLDLVMRTFLDQGDDVVYCYPSYGMYPVLAAALGANKVELQLNDDFSVPDAAFKAKGKLFILCSPNNPDGRSVPNDTIRRLCESFPGIVLVDEAYADFSETTALPLLRDLPNLLVARTFSKGYSLAGLRVGYLVGDRSVVREIQKVKLPFNVPLLSQVAATSAVKHRAEQKELNAKVVAERERLAKALAEVPKLEVLPSDANFLLIKLPDQSVALKIFWELKKRKILIRHFPKKRLYEFLRITVGTPEQNDKFLEGFKEVAKEYLT